MDSEIKNLLDKIIVVDTDTSPPCSPRFPSCLGLTEVDTGEAGRRGRMAVCWNFNASRKNFYHVRKC
jgi:hypothetical protein